MKTKDINRMERALGIDGFYFEAPATQDPRRAIERPGGSRAWGFVQTVTPAV